MFTLRVAATTEATKLRQAIASCTRHYEEFSIRAIGRKAEAALHDAIEGVEALTGYPLLHTSHRESVTFDDGKRTALVMTCLPQRIRDEQ